MNFKTSSLAAAVFAAISSTPLMAEEALKDKEEVEVIEVTGIRGSLVNSLFDKRASDSIIDGVAAEDIGKFPDQNVAESLQRITGVTIDRGEGGEGQKISIRGFGSNFNNVLFNGRSMPTDDSSRGFSFDLVASELISGADVYKTLRADTIEGGLGGTVNVHTARPFDYDGFKGVASVKGVHDTLADSTTPFVSALISQNFDSDFGVLASFAYQQRDARMDQAGSTNFRESNVQLGGPDSDFTEDKFRRPQSAFQRYELSDRERIGGTLVGQWQAADNVLVTADVLYSNLTAEKEGHTLSRYFSNPQFNAEVDGNGTVTEFDRSVKPFVSPGVFQLYDNGKKLPIGQWNSAQYADQDRDSTTTMFGLNVAWDVSDNFVVNVDLHSSKAEARSKNNPNITVANPTQTPAHWEDTGDSFKWETNDANFYGDASQYHTNNVYLTSDDSDDEITEFRIDSEWQPEDLGLLTSVKAGVYYSDREKTKNRAETPWGDVVKGMYAGFYANVPESLFYKISPDGGFLSDHDDGGFVNNWLTFNPDDLFAYLISDEARANADHRGEQIMNNFANGDDTYANEAEAQAAADAAVALQLAKIDAGFAANPSGGKYGPYTPVHNAGKSWVVTEETIAAYIEANFAGDSWSGNFGLRYITTDTESVSAGEEFVGMEEIPGTGGYIEHTNTSDTIMASASYDKILPSVNLKFDLTEDVVARISYSESLTRPNLSQLISAQSISASAISDGQGGTEFNGTINGQNPELKPYTSSNVDIALEWYYSDDSYLGATYFSKNLTDWIVSSTQDVTLYDSISNVDREFQQTSPFNTESAEISGIEMAMLHNFDSGFGVQANYTLLDTSAASDETSTSNVNMNGLSETSYNLIGYYEQGPIQARIAYNWREGYTTCNSCSWGDPMKVDNYGQVDASVSYDISEQFTVFADVINLLDEDPYKYTVHKNRTISITDTGTRYSVGVRATF
ncbi:TonB-dependent receptor [Thalassotalea fonticola]|uniref:TonB-dependent receptor n=1 Tax=Thalassotalea fonticola TaxID=3065649 RepID=A0ABZ0GK75_9GAMM|nr:TonB-dependent receptor [Colwelliaceae bacterium S1-1]